MDCKVFQALSEEIRLRMLLLLASGEINVTQLTRRLGVPQPTVSRHLKVLADAGIVRSARRGKQVYYCIEIQGIRQARDFMNRLMESCPHKALTKTEEEQGKRRLRLRASKSSKVVGSDWEEKGGQIAPIGRSDMDDFLL